MHALVRAAAVLAAGRFVGEYTPCIRFVVLQRPQLFDDLIDDLVLVSDRVCRHSNRWSMLQADATWKCANSTKRKKHNRRKRVGVEPTRDWLTTPPGFEVRTPHRGRFSSNSFHSNTKPHFCVRTNRACGT